MQESVMPYKVIAGSPVEMIAFEECLVRSWTGPETFLLFYINAPSIIIGRNQNYWREVTPSCPILVFRRTSGGGAVYHDRGNVNWSFIVPRERHSQEHELSLMIDAISSFGIRAFYEKRGAIFVSINNKEGNHAEATGKICGTAREFGTNNVLHHGTLLVSADLDTLEASLGGIEVLEDKAIASVPSIPVDLNQFVPSLTVEEAIILLSNAIAGAMPREIRLPKSEGLMCEDFMQEEVSRNIVRFGSREWIKDRSPPFSIVICSEAEGAQAVVSIKESRVASITASTLGDQNGEEYAKRLRFMGIQFDFPILAMMKKEHLWTSF